MLSAGAALFAAGICYYLFTKDTPEGDFEKRRARRGMLAEAAGDMRVWALALLYAASFGMELTIDNFAALYYTDHFHLPLKTAGLVAGTFGLMNLFARALGGIASDRCAQRWGLQGRAFLLGATILAEGLALMLFSRMRLLPLAIASMILTGLFVKMANGANYAIVPFVNRRALGAVAGIVGAGGNAGAVLAGLLFKTPRLSYPQAFFILGAIIAILSGLALALRFKIGDTAGALRVSAAKSQWEEESMEAELEV